MGGTELVAARWSLPLMKRLLIVYNKRSANYSRVQKEVLNVAHQLQGWVVGKYEIKNVPVEQNIAHLAKILQNGDLVVVAGGDGTASVAVNGVMHSHKDVTLGVLGYGNFNDLAHTLGAKSLSKIIDGYQQHQVETIWPLAIAINKQFWRFAPCYFTVGLLATSTEIFEQKETRKKLKKRRHGIPFSIWTLAKWYFRTRKKREFLPKVRLNGHERSHTMTDYLAINSKKVANIMHGSDSYLRQDVFWRSMVNLRSFGSLVVVMVQSILKRFPGQHVISDMLEFEKPVSVGAQIEGEYYQLKAVQSITIDKAKQGLKVIKLR